MSDKRSDWVYDELICFLGSAFFQIPVNGFIEVKCLIFDPMVEANAEHKKVHNEYKQVVQDLLDAFVKDTELSHDQVIKALKEMNSKTDIREVFQGLFELVLAMEDYEIFVRMMTQKNIELQQQALMLILKTQGALPDSLTEGPANPPQTPRPQDTEEELMRKVLEQSKREYENEQKKLKRQETKEKVQMEKTVEMSKHEVVQLQEQKKSEQEKMHAAMANLALQGDKGMSPLVPVPQAVTPQKPTIPQQEKPVIGTPGVSEDKGGKPKPGITITDTDKSAPTTASLIGPGLLPLSQTSHMTSSEAAANWLKSAQTESASGDSDAVQKAAAAMSGMSADEIKKRQEYLRQQRDKLIAMKKKEREKQLLTAEQSNPGRPASAQAARKMLQGDKVTKPEVSAEEQKKIEMRRQIANKLKAELMEN